jgi:hypothetical protein
MTRRARARSGRTSDGDETKIWIARLLAILAPSLLSPFCAAHFLVRRNPFGMLV